jgi:hypothetical protein
MTPKEKAKELFDKFYNYADSNYGASEFEKNWHGNVLAGERKVRKESAKQCVLITVDEIIKFMEMDDEHNECLYFANSKWVQYLMEVKQEIKKI